MLHCNIAFGIVSMSNQCEVPTGNISHYKIQDLQMKKTQKDVKFHNIAYQFCCDLRVTPDKTIPSKSLVENCELSWLNAYRIVLVKLNNSSYFFNYITEYQSKTFGQFFITRSFTKGFFLRQTEGAV